ncbi:thioredoxin domain-containing protein 3 [Ursus maritimus]|uniref:Thioredoxin domain-containing protein 3 n=1 Tax=Ursus maritimus TaxID=29073 RepID=A0A8M1GYR7_URSMA|nr:thioredoxin domain-containing protein 3 [Ursus maritimus]
MPESHTVQSKAEADNIVTLQPFRDKCEPVFLFSVNGKIIAQINGANAPLVNQKIINLVNEERKIAAGEMVRPQYHEIVFVDPDADDGGEAPSESVDQLYIIAIIKPDAVISRKSQEIRQNIIKAGFVIEIEEKRALTERQVRDFYYRIADQPDFEDFVLFMTGGLSHVLVLSQGTEEEPALEETEPNPETEAKGIYEDHSPGVTTPMMKKRDSLQEYLERQHVSQFCDIEENITDVNHFIDMFFPDFKSMKNLKLEKILALLRPALFQEKKEDVLKIIEDEGFKILMQRQIVLSEEEAQTLCKEYENEDYFEKLIEKMTRGPSLVLVLTKWNAISDWRRLMGPTDPDEAKLLSPDSIRAKFGRSILKNAVHGASNTYEAMESINRIFQEFVPENPEGN